MKRFAAYILVIALAVSLVAPCALAYGSTLQGYSDEELMDELLKRWDDNAGTSSYADSVFYAKATQKLSTRSGPSTFYSETDTYQVIGEQIRIISRADDSDGVCWVQCDIPVGSTYRRLYTGLKRFDTTYLDIRSVPLESPLDYRASVTKTTKAMYGPGGNYGTYGKLTVDKGQTVTIIAIEGDYAQVEWKTSKSRYRAWVPLSILRY